MNIYKLNELCSPKQWKTISSKNLLNNGYPVYGANGKIGYYSEYNHEKETILVTCRGATCGTVNICEPFSYVNGNAMALDNVNEEIVNIDYLFYYLKYRGFDDVISGSAQPQIVLSGISKIKVPLPDIDVQKKVSNIIKTLEKIIDKRQAQIVALDELIQSIFLDMFGNPVTNPKKEPLILFSEILEGVRYGTSTPPQFVDNGYKFIRATNIKKGKIIDDNMLFIGENEAERIRKCKLKLHEIIFVRSGVNAGDNALITEKYAGEYGGYDIIVSLNLQKVNPYYLNVLFNTDYLKVVIKPLTRRAGQPHLNADQIKGLEIIMPSLEKQNEFETRLKTIEKYKTLLIESQIEMYELYSSTLQRAFKGELFQESK